MGIGATGYTGVSEIPEITGVTEVTDDFVEEITHPMTDLEIRDRVLDDLQLSAALPSGMQRTYSDGVINTVRHKKVDRAISMMVNMSFSTLTVSGDALIHNTVTTFTNL